MFVLNSVLLHFSTSEILKLILINLQSPVVIFCLEAMMTFLRDTLLQGNTRMHLFLLT